MDFWKNHKLTILLNEAPKPILLVWFFIKDLIKHIFKLFSLSWLGSRKALNKNVIIPSCIAAFFTILLFSLSSFIMSKFNMSRNAADTMFFMVIILNLLSVAWGFSTVSSVVLAKDENKDDSWKNHISAGFKSMKFFIVYMFLIVLTFSGITLFSSFGLLPQIGQLALSLMSIPFYFMGLIIILSVLGLLLGTSLFGGYLLSGDYDESASFTDRTKSLFCMVLRKIIDWIGISIPNFLIAFLFVVVPTSLTVISIELIKSPSEGLYGVKFPNIYSLKTNHIEYPNSYEVGRMQSAFNAKKDKLDMNQLRFERSGSDQQSFLSSLNNSWNDEEKWSFENNKLVLNENDSWSSVSWVVKHNQISYSENNRATWESNKNGDVRFIGRYDYSFFIWLSGIALIFASSVILSVPLGFFYACSASTYYLLYNTSFDLNVIKKILSVVLLLGVIFSLFSVLLEVTGFSVFF